KRSYEADLHERRTLEERNSYHRPKRRSLADAVIVVKRLLLKARRETERVIHRNGPGSIADAAPQRLDVGNQDPSLNVVVEIEPLTMGEAAGRVHRPAWGGFHLHAHARHENLRGGKFGALDPPGTYVSGEPSDAYLVAPLVLQACPGGRGEELSSTRTHQQTPPP